MLHVFCEDLGTVSLGAALGRGACGAVHLLNGHPGLVAKILNADQRGPNTEFELKTIKTNTFDLKHVCGIRGLVRERPRREAIGFWMNREDSVPLTQARHRSPWHRVRFALDGLRDLKTMKDRDIYYSDAHEENVRQRTATGEPVFIDIDSASFPETDADDGSRVARQFAMGAQEWLPPENCGNPNPEHNDFTVRHTGALFTWYSLQGHHPALVRDLDGRDLPLASFVTNLEFGRFAYPRNDRLVPADEGIRFDSMPPQLQALFASSFSVRGLRDPLNRPPLEDYIAALEAWMRRGSGVVVKSAVAVGSLVAAVGLGGAALFAAFDRQPARPVSTQKSVDDSNPNDTSRPLLWRGGEGQK